MGQVLPKRRREEGFVMSARILEFRPAKAGRHRPVVADVSASDIAASWAAQSVEFWTGATGARFVHTVFGLIECPDLPRSNYVLVCRDADGRRQSLRVGRVESDAPSLNLAEIRQTGAMLGATEVHVHLIAGNEPRRRMVELDLSAAEGCGLGRLAANS